MQMTTIVDTFRNAEKRFGSGSSSLFVIDCIPLSSSGRGKSFNVRDRYIGAVNINGRPMLCLGPPSNLRPKPVAEYCCLATGAAVSLPPAVRDGIQLEHRHNSLVAEWIAFLWLNLNETNWSEEIVFRDDTVADKGFRIKNPFGASVAAIDPVVSSRLSEATTDQPGETEEADVTGDPNAGDGVNSAYIAATELMATRDEIKSHPQLNRWLKAHPMVRTRHPSPQRLEIHAGDWARAWKEYDKTQDEALHGDALAEKLADTAARETIGRN